MEASEPEELLQAKYTGWQWHSYLVAQARHLVVDQLIVPTQRACDLVADSRTGRVEEDNTSLYTGEGDMQSLNTKTGLRCT